MVVVQGEAYCIGKGTMEKKKKKKKKRRKKKRRRRMKRRRRRRRERGRCVGRRSILIPGDH